MAKRFKFRYVNEIVGAFVLLVVILLISGVVVAGHAQHWFEKKGLIYLRFPPEGSMELQEGADVMVMGTKVGTVKFITVDADGRMSGTVQVRGPFMRFVRQDSVAVVKRKMVITGDAYIELTRGSGSPLPREGAVLECRQDTEIMEVAMAVLEEVKAQTTNTLALVNAAIAEYTAVAAGMNDPQGSVQLLLANVNGLLEDVRSGEGTSAKLLNDPEMAASIGESVKQVEAIVRQVNALLIEVQTMVATLPPAVAAVSEEAENLPIVVGDAQTLMRESTTLLEGLQKHWLLRRYMNSDANDSSAMETLP